MNDGGSPRLSPSPTCAHLFTNWQARVDALERRVAEQEAALGAQGEETARVQHERDRVLALLKDSEEVRKGDI